MQAILLRVLGTLGAVALVAATGTTAVDRVTKNTVAADAYARLPLAFEQNRGQYPERVRFVARGAGATLAIRDRDLSLALANGARLRLRFAAGRAQPRLHAGPRLPGRTNYLFGDDPDQWVRGVPTFRSVDLRGIAHGIDLRVYGNGSRLEYDVAVASGTDPEAARFSVDGAGSLALAANGDLLIVTKRGTLRQRRPLAYQRTARGRLRIPSRYVLRGRRAFGFRVGPHDRSRPLVIDPVLPFYATYLGGAARDFATDVAVDGAGNAYVGGWTDSVDFPTANAPDGTLARDASFCGSVDPCADAFVTKLNAAGTAIVYSTYLGGSWDDRIKSIDLDSAGNAYVTGKTTSTDFPTANAYDSSRANGAIGDGFVAKLSPDGSSLVYSTYLGGFGIDDPLGIKVGTDGSATVAGNTLATDFPTTGGALARTCAVDPASGYCYRNFFVTKLSPTGGSLLASTYVPIGRDGPTYANAAAFDGSGGVYFTGATASMDFPVTPGAFQTSRTSISAYDAFVLKVNGTSSIAYATLIGGDYGVDEASGIAVDGVGAAYVTGRTDSARFPVTPNALDSLCERTGEQCGNVFDAFVSKLSPNGAQLQYSTFLGSDGRDYGRAIAVDSTGNVTVAGEAGSYNLPTREPYQAQPLNVNCQRVLSADCGDIFITRFAPDWTLTYSTYFGASNLNDSSDIASALALNGGSAFLAGATTSSFLGTPGAYKTSCGVSSDGVCDANAGDALVARFDFAPAGACSVDGSVLSMATNGSPISIVRNGFAIEVRRGGALDANCGAGTVTGISQVNIIGTDGSDDVTVDLGGGAFAPGSRPEPDGDQEIKFGVDLGGGSDVFTIRGGEGPDRFLQSREWGDLTPDADHDTILRGVERIVIDGRGGGDQLRAWGAGAAITVRGGAGTDDLLGNEGDDTIDARDGEIDTVQCGNGNDTVLADAADTVAGDCENVDRGGGTPPSRPPNDDFANAQPTGLNGATLTGSNAGATKEPGEPAHAGNPGGASVWYRWVAPGDGMAAVTTQGTPFDTLLAAYRGATLSALTPVASNDDWQTATSTRQVSTIRFRVQAGVEYEIAVDGKNGISGSFTLGFSFTHPGQPNDLWIDAQPIAGSSGWITGDTTAATTEFNENYQHNGSSVWYRWVAPETGVAAFATETTTTQGVTGIFVYTGGTFDLLAAQPLADRSPETRVNVTAGTTYWLAVTSMGGAFTLTWHSGHPRNDAFAAAEWLGYPYTDVGIANGGATLEPGEPQHAGATGGASLWYRWTAPASGRAEFYTRASGVDTVLAVYTGTTLTSLTAVAANDDQAAGDPSSYVAFDAVGGRVYRIAVDVKGGAWTTFRLDWYAPVTAISNETVAGAGELTGVSGTATSGLGTGKENGEPDHAGNPGGRSIWFTWTAPSSGTTTIDTQGSSFNTLLAVYSGYARHDISTLVPVAANDDASATVLTSRVSFDAVGGTTYWIALDGWSDGIDVAGGAANLSWLLGSGQSGSPKGDIAPPETTIGTAPGNPTTATSATFTFSASEQGSAFACALDAAAFSSCTSPQTYDNLGQGSHTFRVRATDPAGNADLTPAEHTWTIQTATTAAPSPAPPPSVAAGGSGGGGVPPDLHVDLAASAANSPAVGSELVYFVKLSVKNAGSASAVRLDLALPAGFTVTRSYADRGSGCNGSGTALTCDVAWISPGTPSNVTIWGIVNLAGETAIRATATSLVEPELDGSDNTAELKLLPAQPVQDVAGSHAASPAALRPPVITGRPLPGNTLHALPPAWTSPPTRIIYQWQLCSTRGCAAIPGATGRQLKLRRSYAGHSVRVVVTGITTASTTRSISARLRIPPQKRR